MLITPEQVCEVKQLLQSIDFGLMSYFRMLQFNHQSLVFIF